MTPQRKVDFDLLVDAAVNGERCPMSWPHGPLKSQSITELYRGGWIRSEVYRQNFRVVTILRGEHAGKKTNDVPVRGQRPYLINGEKVYA